MDKVYGESDALMARSILRSAVMRRDPEMGVLVAFKYPLHVEMAAGDCREAVGDWVERLYGVRDFTPVMERPR